MESSVLREVIEVEKEIQQALEREREKTGEWLLTRKREIEEELSRGEKELALSFQLSRERAARDAGNRASYLVQEAERQTSRLAQLTNAALSGIVANHIKKILPG